MKVISARDPHSSLWTPLQDSDSPAELSRTAEALIARWPGRYAFRIIENFKPGGADYTLAFRHQAGFAESLLVDE